MGTTASKLETETETEIENAIEYDDIDTFKDLTKGDFTVNTIITEGKTPLILAAHYGSIKIATFLIDEGAANVNAKFDNNKSVLFAAIHGFVFSCNKKNFDMVELLIKKSADVHARDNEGKTVLIYAVDTIISYFEESKGLLELLIKEGADVNARDSQGRTALYYAKKKNYPEITKLLEEAQAEKEEAAKAQLAHSAPVGADGGTSESEGDVKIEGEEGMKDGDA
jgi:ankyrin repeat protein